MSYQGGSKGFPRKRGPTSSRSLILSVILREGGTMRMYIGFVLGLVVGFVLGWTAQMSNDINEKNRGRPWAPELVEQRFEFLDSSKKSSLDNHHYDNQQVNEDTLEEYTIEEDLEIEQALSYEEEKEESPLGEEQADKSHQVLRAAEEPSKDREGTPTEEPAETGLHQYLSSRMSKVHVAVLLNEDHVLSMSYAISSTWGAEGDVVFYTTSSVNPSHLPDGISVKTVSDFASKLVLGTLKLVHQSLPEDVQWVVMAADSVYMQLENLVDFLSSLDGTTNLMFGRKAHGQSYCSLQYGFVLSRELIKTATASLEKCVEQLSVLGEEDREGDSVLGHCLQQLGVTCRDDLGDFLYYFNEEVLSANMIGVDVSGSIFLSPLKYPKLIYRLYLYLENAAITRLKSEVARRLKDAKLIEPYVPSRLRIPMSHDQVAPDQPACEGHLRGSPIQPHRARSQFDLLTWEYFNQTKIMAAEKEYPSHGLVGVTRNEIRFALTQGLAILRKSLAHKVKFVLLENGFRRVSPSKGIEYILDLVVKDNNMKNLHKRVRFYLPLSSPAISVEMPVSPPRTTINILTTMSRVGDRAKGFLETFCRLAQSGKPVTMTITLFQDGDSTSTMSIIENYQKIYSLSSEQLKVIPLEGKFARGVGLAEGMKYFNNGDLVFISDVDMLFNWNFLQRCYLNTVRGSQVYFPIFFKFYNRNFVESHTLEKISAAIGRHMGHWAYYSYGMLCMYAEDYGRTKGYNTNLQGWGEEDVDFYKSVLVAGLEVFRSPDPGLLHQWHKKECSAEDIADSQVLHHCMRSRGENVGDRIELANFLFTLAKDNPLVRNALQDFV